MRAWRYRVKQKRYINTVAPIEGAGGPSPPAPFQSLGAQLLIIKLKILMVGNSSPLYHSCVLYIFHNFTIFYYSLSGCEVADEAQRIFPLPSLRRQRRQHRICSVRTYSLLPDVFRSDGMLPRLQVSRPNDANRFPSVYKTRIRNQLILSDYYFVCLMF